MSNNSLIIETTSSSSSVIVVSFGRSLNKGILEETKSIIALKISYSQDGIGTCHIN